MKKKKNNQAPKTPRASSGSRMAKSGKKPSQLWYTPENYELVKRASEIDGRSMTKFAIRAAVSMAKNMLAAQATGHIRETPTYPLFDSEPTPEGASPPASETSSAAASDATATPKKRTVKT